MVHAFLLLYATVDALSSYSNTCTNFIFSENFQAEKGSLQFKGVYVALMPYAVPFTSNFRHFIGAYPVFQTCIR